MNKNKAIFLDRDGIINKSIIINNKPHSPKSIAEVELVSGIKELLGYLSRYYLLIVITNQPEIARGSITLLDVIKINDYLYFQSGSFIADFYICPHDDMDSCFCRKPKPGMLLDAAQKYNIDLSQSHLVGDRWSDIEAGNAAGCQTIWVDYGYHERKPYHSDFIVHSIKDIVSIIQ